MTAHTQRRLGRVAITASSVVLFAAALVAQSSPPPIPGATGVVEPEGTKNGGTAAVAAVAVKTVEGTRHLLRAMGIGGDDGDKNKDVDPLQALQLGTTVLVRDAAVAAVPARTQGDAPTAEAKVIDINRRTGVIVIRRSDRTTEKLQLAGRTGDLDAGAPQDAGGTISLSYVDENGQKVVLSFRKAS